MFKRGDIANNLFLICFTHMECILCGWGRIGYSDVSIHAPTRGATNSQILFTMSLVFQSTHPHGVRPLAKAMYLPALQFQSTHPHGVRLDYIKHLHLYQGVSIHAPTRGATLDCSDSVMVVPVSIHAPTRGAT